MLFSSPASHFSKQLHYFLTEHLLDYIVTHCLSLLHCVYYSDSPFFVFKWFKWHSFYQFLIYSWDVQLVRIVKITRSSNNELAIRHNITTSIPRHTQELFCNYSKVLTLFCLYDGEKAKKSLCVCDICSIWSWEVNGPSLH